ncbi:MAG TPA: pirin family protein [Acidobacteriota bacterium]|nr:pirin family protein [Acidobacteriota bacterium]
MTITIVPSKSRGQTAIGWLKSRHSFSFGNYRDPNNMNFGALKVFNDDQVQPNKGFDTHSHANFEIVSIVLEGQLKHKDSMGHEETLNENDVQRISAGTGIEHSEFAGDQPVHFIQLWIAPRELNIKPSYEQKSFDLEENYNEFVTLVHPDDENTIKINADATISRGQFEPNLEIEYTFPKETFGIFIFVVDGKIDINGQELKPGDAAKITDEDFLITTLEECDILLLELPK